MVCLNCKNQIVAGTKFCTRCGTEVNNSYEVDNNQLLSRLNRIEILFAKYVSEGSLSPEEIAELSKPITPEAPSHSSPVIETRINQPSSKDEPVAAPTSSVTPTSTITANIPPHRSNEPQPTSPTFAYSRQTSYLTNLDKLIGINWLAIIGGLLVVLSLGILSFGLYALGGQGFRFGFILFIGSVFIILGELIRGKYSMLDQVFSGIGISVIYALVYATTSAGKIDPILGLILLGTVGIAGGYIALRANGMWIAILGTSGVFASPFIINDFLTNSSLPFFIIYLLVMDIVILGISTVKNWNILNQISLWGSYLFIYASASLLEIEDVETIIIISLILVHLIFFGITSVFHLIRNNTPSFQDLMITMSNTVLFYISCILMLPSDSNQFAAINLWLAVSNGSIGLLIYRKRDVFGEYGTVLITKSAIFLMVAVPIYFSGISTTIIWALMSAGVTFIGLYSKEWKWRLYGTMLFSLSFLKLSFVDIPTESIPYNQPGWNADNWLINSSTITLFMFVVSAWASYLLYQRKNMVFRQNNTESIMKEDSRIYAENNLMLHISNFAGNVKSQFIRYEFWRPSLLTLVATSYLGIFAIYHISGSGLDTNAKVLYISLFTGIYGISILYTAVIKQSILFRMLGNIFTLSSALISFTGILSALGNDPSHSHDFFNPLFISYIAVILLLVICIFIQTTFRWPTHHQPEIDYVSIIGSKFLSDTYLHILPIVTFFSLGYQLFAQYDLFGNSLNILAFTVYIALYSCALLFIPNLKYIYNRPYSKAFYQICGCILLALTVSKFLLSDIYVANIASKNYAWDGFLGLTGYAMIPIINPYFLVGLIIIASIYITMRYGLTKINQSDTKPNNTYINLIYNYKHIVSIFMAISLGSILVLIGSREIILWFEHANSIRPPVLLSLYWALCSIALILLGIKMKEQRMRITGLLLLAVPILKIFTWDAWTTDPYLAFFSFFFLGCLLLGVSFIYQKNKSLVISFLSGEPQETSNDRNT